MNRYDHAVLSHGRAKFSAPLSAAAIGIYLLPVAFALSILRGGTGSFALGLLLLVYGYQATLVLAAAAVAFARPPRFLVLVPVLIALTVPTVAVALSDGWGNLNWHVIFITYLPGGLLVAAPAALLIRLAAVRERGGVIALASLAVAGSAAAPVLTFPLAAQWEIWYYLATVLLLVSLGSNIGLALWLRGADRNARLHLSRES